MSQDEKEEDKNFLLRWSQRKRAAEQPVPDKGPAEPAEDVDASPVAIENEPAEPFDLSSLPKLEDLTETTDITGFLHKGVPESLRNAALRKSWALDPAIRNYVNPALDYAYDWNTPGGVPGNSEIGAGTDIARMLLQIMGDGSSNDSQSSDGLPDHIAASSPRDGSGIDVPQTPQPDLPLQQIRLSDLTKVPSEDAAGSEDAESVPIASKDPVQKSEPSAPQQAMRRHGTAKPKI